MSLFLFSCTSNNESIDSLNKNDKPYTKELIDKVSSEYALLVKKNYTKCKRIKYKIK